ncbi:MAG: hypothetical protein KDJ65_21675 [Anaerolineae bacterium]|nr:hypothetical protein [Anaerolineae bacterium]
MELIPNSPSQRDLVDTYNLRLWIHDQLIYEQIHSVRNWQMRHFYVEEIAKAFRNIRILLGKEIQISEDNEERQSSASFLSFVNAALDTDWLRVILAATQPKRTGDLVHVSLYLRKTENTIGDFEHRSTGQWGVWEEMVAATIFCTPEDAIAFGVQLQEEIRQVEQERVSLGIPKYDDTDKFE